MLPTSKPPTATDLSKLKSDTLKDSVGAWQEPPVDGHSKVSELPMKAPSWPPGIPQLRVREVGKQDKTKNKREREREREKKKK